LTIKFTQATNSRLRELAQGNKQTSLFDSLRTFLKSQISNLRFEISYRFSGDFVGRVTPVPIPNTEVKPAGADGTARVTVWESRKSPGLIQKPARLISRGLFVCLLVPEESQSA
jgi:hypothetical protein